ncbi:TPA_asm: coat protein [ssRNA phage Gerhypos.1_24]|uniref:Coat protein n=2 Tax=Leviviricetes TaxID=2842243 RepID=A0A8S5L2K7_9VIRU|nr:coat protein [ssRNA phage Gerhypos.1_24]QDH89527.1 MAG: hypothetical protein H1Bulk29406_000002 [Leviviridae sp.]DAD51881.1 TPA_asm: coat protein [ssRNA phage Gerhypos.1_24]
MNFSADIVLDDADGTDVTYRRVGSLQNGSRWIDTATTLTAPALMEVLHNTTGKGADTVDRHLVRMTRTIADAAGVPRTLTVNFTLAVPRSAVMTNQIVYDEVANLLDFLTDQALTAGLADTDCITSLLRGES